MKLKVLGSSSAGNCYILTDTTGHSLIIEAGVKFSEIKQALNHKIRKFSMICSHSHGDHTGYIKQALEAYVPVYSSAECLKESGAYNYPTAISVEPEKVATIGNFKFIPFDVKHDVRCFGYLIHHEECGTVLFATDTFDITQKFASLNNVIIEANYDYNILTRNTEEGGVDRKRKQRIIDSHMEISRAIHILKRQDMSTVNNIVLIHLSDANSNADDFKKRMEQATGKTVHIAEKGMEIEFNKYPF